MINKIKEYLEYRNNKKIAKRELAKIGATTLPVVREMSNKGNDVFKFIKRVDKATRTVGGEKLIQMILNEVSTALQTDNERIIEIAKYMATLSYSDIQKILVHSVVETSQTDDDK